MKYAKSSETGSESGEVKINWQEYNYPCCLKIFHYNSDETPQALRWQARLLWLNHALIIFALLWNFLTNIVGTAQGIDQGGIRIAISIFLFLAWIPGSFYGFIIPYKIYMKEKSKAFVFYILAFAQALFFLIWSIADFADANGWAMVRKYSDQNMGGATFFAVICSILMLAISIIAVVNMVYFCRRKSVD